MSQSSLLMSGCTHWVKNDVRWYDDSVGNNEKRDRGTRFHAHPAAEIAGVACADKPDDKEMERMVAHASTWIRDNLTTAHWALSEVAFALDTATAKGSLLLVEDRNYPDTPGLFCGTADIVAQLSDDTLLIADWKTGAGAGAHEQLLSLAAAAADVYPWAKLFKLATLLVTPEGVVEETSLHPREVILGRAFVLSKKLKVLTEPNPGVHCVACYCPALAFCKETYRGLGPALRMVEHKKDREPRMSGFKFTENPTSASEAALLVRNGQAMKRAAEHFIECGKRYAAKGNAVADGDYEWKDIGNGYRWYKR